MQYRQLRYYVKIVEAGSFSRAASLIYVAQPALSEQISELEESLGTLLLQRTPRGVRPTPAGEILYREAASLLKHLDTLPDIVRTSVGSAQGEVSLGLPAFLGPALVGRFVEMCRSALSGVKVKLAVTNSFTLREKVRSKSIELGLVFEDEPEPGLARQPLYRQQLYVFHPNPMIVESPVSLAALASLPLILPSRPSLLRATIDRVFAQEGLTPSLVAEVDDFSSTLSTVRTGMGVALVPSGAPAELGEGIAGPVPTEPPIHMTASILTSNDAPLSEPAREIRTFLHNFIQRHVRETPSAGALWIN